MRIQKSGIVTNQVTSAANRIKNEVTTRVGRARSDEGDTFTRTVIPKPVKANLKMSDAMERSYVTGISQKNKVLGTRFLAIVKDVVDGIDGVTFDKARYEAYMLKGAKSFMSKIRRSSALPLDQIRTTVYIKDIDNLTYLNSFVKGMSDRGYEVVDLDIRRSGVDKSELKKLPEQLRDTLSDRLPSGLGDIQLRFRDTAAKTKTPMEVIIMPGPNTADAKIVEEDDIYQYLRELKSGLHFTRQKPTEGDSPLKRIKESVSIIADTLRGSISRPMYSNAEALDVRGEELGLPVGITRQTATVIRGFLENIRSNIGLHYGAEIEKVKSNDYQKEIERMIKASPEFKERADKTIYLDDILPRRDEMIDNLEQQKSEDLSDFIKIQNGLKKTLTKYTFKN